MAHNRNTWPRLVPGILACLAIGVAAGSVLLFARVGALHGDTFSLSFLVDEARGMIPGSEVWLEGQKIGLVKRIEFRPPSADTMGRLRVEIEVLTQYQPQIRRDSKVEIRNGGSLIGAPVVYLSVGSPNEPVLENGARLRRGQQVDIEGVASRFAIASRDLPQIIANIKAINGGAARAIDRLGVGNREPGTVSFNTVTEHASRLGERATGGSGTMGLVMRDTQLLARARRALAHADTAQRLLQSARGPLGKLRNDSTLLRQIADARDEISIVRALVVERRGSAGRFLADSAIVQQLTRFERELGETMRDLKKNPGRYIAF